MTRNNTAKTTDAETRRIDKPLFEAGSQCAKRFHLEAHGLRPKPRPSEFMTELGQKVVELARKEFRGGTAMDGLSPEEAVAKTRETIEAGKPAILFDAHFECDETIAQADIAFVIGPSELDLFEVKAGTTVKRRHLFDVALQIHTIEKAGFKVRGATVLHLDPKYVHEGGGNKYPTEKLFRSVDVTNRARKLLPGVSGRVHRLLENFDNDEALDLPTGTWCKQPLPCPFLKSCLDEGPESPLILLPEMTRDQEASFHEAGVEDVSQLDPENESLRGVQKRAVQAIVADEPKIESFVADELHDFDYPAMLLHVHWHVEVLPTFDNQRPWQKLPCAWSAKILDEDGNVEQMSFVAQAGGDPRQVILDSLLEAVQGVEMLVTYQPDFEKRVRSMIDDGDAFKSSARAILNVSHLELATLVEGTVYAPSFDGSFDLATVHDALCKKPMPKSMPRTELDESFRKLLNTRTRAKTRERLAEALTEHCDNHTTAMLALLTHLRST